MEPRKIVVRLPNWVGDVVMATPAIRALRRRFPAAEITLLMKAYVGDLLRDWKVVDRQILIDKRNGSGLLGTWRTSRLLREERFDLAVLFPNSLGSALEVFWARIPRRVGYADGRSLFLTDRVRGRPRVVRDTPIPMVDLYAKIVAALGAVVDDRRYEVPISVGDQSAADAWLQKAAANCRSMGPWIGLNPGAKFGSSKLWSADNFAAVADRLIDRYDARILLLGGPGEEPLLDAIRRSMRGSPANAPDDIVRLGPLKGVLARLSLLLTTDTGPRAIAQALDIPNVVVMGPTHPLWTNANLERSIVLRHDVDCGPCHKKLCPLDHRCMTLITTDEVFEAARKLMS